MFICALSKGKNHMKSECVKITKMVYDLHPAKEGKGYGKSEVLEKHNEKEKRKKKLETENISKTNWKCKRKQLYVCVHVCVYMEKKL